MTQKATDSQTGDPLFESAGCCGVIARSLGVFVLLGTLIVLGFVLFSGPPDRWQGIADSSAHPLALISDPRHPQTIYAGTEQGHVLISPDGGQSWQEQGQGLPQNAPVSALALLPHSSQLLAGTSKGPFLSLDGGKIWRSAGPGIPAHTIVDAVAALPDGTLLAGTAGSGAYLLPTGGSTWVPATKGLPPQSDIYAFLPLVESGHVLAALISGGIYASQDSGVAWTESDQGLSAASGVNVFTLLAVPGGQGTDTAILAGTSHGMYISHDLGATWQSSSTGIGTTRVISLARDPLTPTEIFAGADTGVYQSNNGGTTWHTLGFGLPGEQHVGAIGVVHPVGGNRVILASVDRLYRYPGQWLLATEPWRALGFGAFILLAFVLLVFFVWQARAMLA